MLALQLLRLQLKDFRNIADLEIEPCARFNVISGDNGQGKTSLLESIYFLATTRSFRSRRLKELQRDSADFSRLTAHIAEGTLTREHKVVLTAKSRSFLIDDKSPARLAEYALRTPVVVFHPGDLELTLGGASLRRDLLDRIALFSTPDVLDDRTRFERSLRERQKALELRGERTSELDTYEELAALHGARLTLARARAAQELAHNLAQTFPSLTQNALNLGLSYQPGGCEDSAQFRSTLHARRAADLRRHLPTFGPHRDDLSLLLDGRTVRQHASQGQHRILTLALKFAELTAIRRMRNAHPLLLLDDVSSELDANRIGAVYDLLQDTQSQVFITTTRPDLFHTPFIADGQRRDFRLRAGRLT